MRRTFLALLLVCGFGLSLASFSTAHAANGATGSVAVTVHLRYCPIDVVNSPDIGFYDGCHDNALGGEFLTLAGLAIEPVSFVTDWTGNGTAVVDGVAAVDQVTLWADASLTGATNSYAYCSDQTDGSVLLNMPVAPGGALPLFTVDQSQEIICDWYIYTD
ncbi:MAG: hypothetical protein KC438_01245 [Thermomicrobiales bacterium]|nr:hypothetical protein [Thermomicrobiales bacterium]MCO5223641.1 hypothetical protein [Thermomicrobiales bacterium]